MRLRRALVADLVLAIVLTALAVAATAATVGGSDSGLVRSLVPAPPSLVRDIPVDQDPLPLLVMLTTLPLAARRYFPLAAFWAVLLAALATHDHATWITVLACAVAAYSAVLHSRHRPVAIGCLVLATVLAGVAFKDAAADLPSWMGPFVVLLTAGVAAGGVRYWRQRLAGVQLAQEEATRRAVEGERARIAAELHDVVTHNVNVMVIQAGAARKVMDAAPDRSKQAMLAVEASGRAAMAELRHVMGLLAGPDSDRADTRADGLEPQPGLGQLDALIDRVRAAGVPVSAEIDVPAALSPGVELTAYRVVQEALTNTLKHGGGASATVVIGHAGGWLEIDVSDAGGRARRGEGEGRGLIGLRERLALYGGTLEAGPSRDGYRTRARLPWESA
ncbi:sensor histidine kinase [Nonomuraea sp. NPDC050556]|uniref:sensor histidine kinase n=1 Tax=Nonomuraea sp. NPDC050556 TaxID=3364369 RepID=UPI00379AD85B